MPKHFQSTTSSATVRYVNIAIPCKPHVLVFIEAKFPNPYLLSLSDWLGMCIYHILRRPQSRFDRVADSRTYTENFNISIREATIREKALRNISDYTIYKINDFIESLIADNFIDYVESRPEGVKEKTAILAWMDKFDFKEGEFINYDNLRRKYSRYKQSRKTEKNLL